MKKCFKCRKSKPLELFYKHPDMLDGHLGKCKSCAKKDVMDRYYSPEGNKKIKEYEKRRFQTPERKRKVLEYARHRQLKFPGKARARRKLVNTLRYNKSMRKPCEKCGDVNTQGHHYDYRKPLDVVWLCFTHHRQTHGQLLY